MLVTPEPSTVSSTPRVNLKLCLHSIYLPFILFHLSFVQIRVFENSEMSSIYAFAIFVRRMG